MKRLILAGLMATLVSLVANPVAVQASCASLGPPTLKEQLDSATTVFVGTVAGTADNDRIARVRVESVWKGSAQSVVTVSGTPAQGAVATSVDRTFTVGQRYLFVPFSNSSPFQDNNCSATQPYSAQLATLRPSTAQPPAAGPDGLDPTVLAFAPFWLWPTAGVAVIGIAIIAWMLARWRRRAKPTL